MIRESEVQVSLQQEGAEELENALRLHEMEKMQLVGALPVYSYSSGIINVLKITELKITENLKIQIRVEGVLWGWGEKVIALSHCPTRKRNLIEQECQIGSPQAGCITPTLAPQRGKML